MMSRTNALTAIARLKPVRLWWCRILLPMLRMVAMSSSLARLRFIHYGGWIVFGGLRQRVRHPGLSLWRHRPTMLFLSDYDGDPHEYLAAFCLAVAKGMQLSFGSAAGFPGPRPTRTFIEYVERHGWPEQFRYTACPDATVRDLDTALEVADRLERIAALPAPPASPASTASGSSQDGFEEQYRALVRVLSLAPEPPPAPSFLEVLPQVWRKRSTVSGLATVMPLDPAHRSETMSRLRMLAQVPEAVFDPVGGVHCARLAVVSLPSRRWPFAGSPQGEPEHLLFSAWFDGAEGDFVRGLVERLGPRAEDIWGGCDGYPGTNDLERLASWILAHRVRFNLFLGSRSGVPAERTQAAAELADQVREAVTATWGRPQAEIHRRLRELDRLHREGDAV